MKKYLWIFLILGLIVGIAVFDFNNNNQEDYTTQKTGININNETQEGVKVLSNTIVNLNNKEKEEQIAEFTTKLPNDTEAREGNIKLACKTLSGTIVKSGEVFSLWRILLLILHYILLCLIDIFLLHKIV